MNLSDIYSLLIIFSGISLLNVGLLFMIRFIKNNKRILMPVGTIIFSICLFFSYYEIRGLFLKYPQVMWLNAPLLFTIGPLFYLHVKRQLKWLDFFHFLPTALIFIWILPFYTKSSAEKLLVIKDFFSATSKPELELMQYLYIFHIGLYLLMGYLALKNRNSLSDDYSSNYNQHKINQKFSYLYLIISILSMLSFLICFISDFFGFYYNQLDKFSIFLLVLLTLTLQIYFSYTGYDLKLENTFIKLKRTKELKANEETNDEQILLIKRLNQLMLTEYLYREPDLKINSLAERLDVSMHFLSATINNQTGNNFFDYVNTLRIEELKCNLLLESNFNYTLFAIAKESGFKSNSSFYRVFKKHTGFTPKAYIEKHKTSQFT